MMELGIKSPQVKMESGVLFVNYFTTDLVGRRYV